MSLLPGKSVGSVLSSSADLREILARTRRLNALQQRLERCLPAAIARHAHVILADEHGCVATVLTENGSVAAKLRHLKPRLLNELRQLEPELNAIDIRVQAPAFVKPLRNKQISLTHPARRALDALISKLPETPLRQVLNRLRNRTGSAHKSEQESFDPAKPGQDH